MLRLLALSFLCVVLAGSSAYGEGAGFCRDCECFGMGCEKDKPCDDKLLKELKAKRDQKIKAYREIVGAAEETGQRAWEALKHAEEVFGKYTQSVATKGATTVGKELFPIPVEVYERYKKYQSLNPGNVSSSEDLLKLTKSYLEELAKEAGYKDAVSRTKWVNGVLSGVLMDAEVLISLKEADFHSEQAFNQWLRGYEALMEARHLEDRIRRLEAECKKKGSGPAAKEPEPDERTSGEREAEEAQKMVDSWRNAHGEIINAEGGVLNEEQAFEEALVIVQSQSSRRLPAPLFFALFNSAVSTSVAQAASDNAFQEEWQRFRIPARRGFDHLSKAVEAFGRASAIVDGIARGK